MEKLQKLLDFYNIKEKAITLKIDKVYQKAIMLEEKVLKQMPVKLKDKINYLKTNELKINTLKQSTIRMKSTLQTYDIRDCEKYWGLLELEKHLRKEGKRQTNADFLNNLQRMSSVDSNFSVENFEEKINMKYQMESSSSSSSSEEL